MGMKRSAFKSINQKRIGTFLQRLKAPIRRVCFMDLVKSWILNLAVWHSTHGLNLIDSTLAQPSTFTLVQLSDFIADSSPAIVDDYQVFKLKVSGTAIWQAPRIISTDLGSGHSTASTCPRSKSLANIQVLPKVDHSKNIRISTGVGSGT